MVQVPSVKAVESEDEFVHVGFREPDEFEEIRTPEWAMQVARDVSDGSKVRMGRRAGGDEWVVQSVLIVKTVGESKAREQASKIVEKIES